MISLKDYTGPYLSAIPKALQERILSSYSYMSTHARALAHKHITHTDVDT